MLRRGVVSTLVSTSSVCVYVLCGLGAVSIAASSNRKSTIERTIGFLRLQGTQWSNSQLVGSGIAVG